MSAIERFRNVMQTVSTPFLKRPDGEIVAGIHPYRRMLSYIMLGRNESVCYYDDYYRADPILDYIARAREAWDTEVDITHCLVAAAGKGMHANPKMNQFIVGKRLYRRNHVAITFSMKRKRMNKEAKLSAVKMRFDDGQESFESICRRINSKINRERSGEDTYTDKELNLLTSLPRPLLSAALSVVRWADDNNLLPAGFIDNDAFYTSMVIANLGSLGMGAAFHHLYEYGTCPLFMMVGKIEERPVVQEGKVVAQRMLHVRWSYDERIDDGLTSKYGMQSVKEHIEHPDRCFGEIGRADASNKKPQISAA